MSILDDPEASGNDRFVALDLLKNACIAAGGVLPMCQDTGTAIVSARKASACSPAAETRRHRRGVFEAYTELNLRYSQMAPMTTWQEVNTGSNLPAQIEIYSTDGDDTRCSSWPRAADRRTRATSTKRPWRCLTRRA